MMRVLVIGGTGVISTAAVQFLLSRSAEVAVFNRGQTPRRWSGQARQYLGDRDEADALKAAVDDFAPDAVIDAICYRPAQAEAAIKVLRGRGVHMVFISTVCTYGGPTDELPTSEQCPQRPVSPYGRDKVACEQLLWEAHREGSIALTIARPSYTYGPGGPLNGGLIGRDWSLVPRLQTGRPILIADEGKTLWHPGHVDDVGRVLAAMCGRPLCVGRAYNTVGPSAFSHVDYIRVTAEAIGCEPNLVHVPSEWLLARDGGRLGFFTSLYRWDGAYLSDALVRDVPEARPSIDLADGVRRTVAWLDRCQQQRPPDADDLEEQLAAEWQRS